MTTCAIFADSAGNDKFMQLCRTAEDFMDQCVLAETDSQLSHALTQCEKAIGKNTLPLDIFTDANNISDMSVK